MRVIKMKTIEISTSPAILTTRNPVSKTVLLPEKFPSKSNM